MDSPTIHLYTTKSVKNDHPDTYFLVAKRFFVYFGGGTHNPTVHHQKRKKRSIWYITIHISNPKGVKNEHPDTSS